jgi:hypothetical protein
MLIPLHGIASRRDLPLPFSFVVVGVVLALVISFAILIFAWRKAAVPLHRRAPTARTDHVFDHPIVQIIARALVFATYAWAGLAMMAGQDLLTNPIFGFLLVWMWVGLVPSRCYSASSGAPPTRCGRSTAGFVRWRASTRNRVWSPCRPEWAGRPRLACSASAGLSWCGRTERRCRYCGSARLVGDLDSGRLPLGASGQGPHGTAGAIPAEVEIASHHGHRLQHAGCGFASADDADYRGAADDREHSS